MKLQMRTIAWVVIVMSWCAEALAADSGMDPKNGKFTIEYLVMHGMAKPDELVVELPKFMSMADLDEFLATKGDLKIVPKEPIGGRIRVLRLVSAPDLPLEEKAKRLQAAADDMNRVRFVRSQEKDRPSYVVTPSSAGSVSPAPDENTLRAEGNLMMDIQTFVPPKDQHFAKQCGLKAVNAEKAWDALSGADASRVKVAIVDSGLFPMHPDLDLNAMPATADDVDANGHGTHVAGIIGAQKDDATGIVGVTWKSDIKAYRFLNARGRGFLDDALTQIDAAVADGAHIVVLAWGTGAHSPKLFEALTNARAKNVLFVAAAGNNGQDTSNYPVYPAAYELDNLISVMATTCDDQLAPFSNFSKTRVDLAAPGEGLAKDMRIFSTVRYQKWGNLAGTSMSAAFVAGAAALVLQPSVVTGTPYKPKQVKCWLNESVGKPKPTALAGRSKSEGRLDLYEAVQPLNTTTCPP